jgi:hypothetical protein
MSSVQNSYLKAFFLALALCIQITPMSAHAIESTAGSSVSLARRSMALKSITTNANNKNHIYLRNSTPQGNLYRRGLLQRRSPNPPSPPSSPKVKHTNTPENMAAHYEKKASEHAEGTFHYHSNMSIAHSYHAQAANGNKQLEDYHKSEERKHFNLAMGRLQDIQRPLPGAPEKKSAKKAGH